MSSNTLNLFILQSMKSSEIFRRFYHISQVNYNVKKQGAKLCKMLNPGSKKKWHPTFTEINTMPSVKSLTKVKYEPGKRGTRRLAILNKLFMKSITDLMSTGSSSIEIVGRGIEISKVQVAQDLQRLNVFWVCKGDLRDEETESLLNSLAGAIRHELSTLRLMGEVPYIVFVKDRQEAHVFDLDRRLSIADYGEDYEPTEIGHLLKTEFTLETKLSAEMRAKIKQVEDALPLEEDPIPVMTHSVFGLDHEKIMNRLLAARKKSKDAWSNMSVNNNVISYRTPLESSPQPDTKRQRQELSEFLQKRQIQQSQLYKEKKAARALKAIQFEREIQNSDEVDDEQDDMYEYEDEDYDEEDITAGVEKWNKPL